MIFDIGPQSAAELAEIISKAGTIVWNGPVGVFEFDQFGEGTKTVSMAIANAAGFSLAGGGDTIGPRSRNTTSMTKCRISRLPGRFPRIPVEGKTLPAVAMLSRKRHASKHHSGMIIAHPARRTHA